MIRVGFDGRAIGSPAAGVRRYATQLFGAMASIPGVEVVAVGARAGVALPDGIVGVAGAPSLPSNVGWMLTGLPIAARRAHLDLFHAPSYTAPFAGPRPLVLTIHDVSYERHPEWYPYHRDPARRAFYRWSARRADRIITDSQFSRSEIHAAYGVPAAAIDVIPLAAAPIFCEGPVTALPAGVVRPFVLHVGDLHARRNVDVAVRALARLRAQSSALASVRIVLAGVDRGAGAALRTLGGSGADGLDLVQILDQTSEDELLALYRGASALVYPSRYEGFGLPILEAMACGTPVIASRRASIPEVAGDAAILLDPDDDTGWAQAIETVLHAGNPAAARLRDAGLRRASAFSWRRTAEATVAVYRRALGASS